MDGIISTAYAQLTGDDWSEVDSGIPEEAPLSIYVNGQELVTFMCTPAGQDALALGFLANEGLITSWMKWWSCTFAPPGRASMCG